ncbi:hypothetical protein H7H82_19945 [Mycobacterium heidelbergense]|uniref:Uncharacterized protein n=1 Tax=Mycobacterium heidelbergense TaxID=53376 RepID=A0A1X0DV03_MYCHE|nr:hypothetical protein [Mycobacterium heidelbergense]MCV7052836.1 hypothetical protein [Mycobacterium heidelbergense]ORA76211.1 hypothetical protein BST25_01310 [Mycobacterium heidelbergense]BBZ51009.1 hypothetical protein MHEI_27260 [Mycobacterium heidelbergense]
MGDLRPEPDAPPLAGYKVVDLSTGIAVAYCTKLLADGGATELEQLAFRGFFEEVEHPVNGRPKLSTVPMRLSAGPGLTPPEIADLEADGVIGHSPA